MFELPHGLPPDEADGAADEWRQTGHAGRRPALVESCQDLERLPVEGPDGALRGHPGVDPGGTVAVLGEDTEAADADEGPARPEATLPGGLEEERAGATVGELPVDADRGLAVGEERADDGDHAVALADEPVEVVAERGAGRVAHPATPPVAAPGAEVPTVSGADAVTGSSGSTSKHRWAPV